MREQLFQVIDRFCDPKELRLDRMLTQPFRDDKSDNPP